MNPQTFLTIITALILLKAIWNALPDAKQTNNYRKAVNRSRMRGERSFSWSKEFAR